MVGNLRLELTRPAKAVDRWLLDRSLYGEPAALWSLRDHGAPHYDRHFCWWTATEILLRFAAVYVPINPSDFCHTNNIASS